MCGINSIPLTSSTVETERVTKNRNLKRKRESYLKMSSAYRRHPPPEPPPLPPLLPPPPDQPGLRYDLHRRHGTDAGYGLRFRALCGQGALIAQPGLVPGLGLVRRHSEAAPKSIAAAPTITAVLTVLRI